MPSPSLPEPPFAGEGVRLRPWTADDASLLVEGWSDPDVRRWNAVPDDTSRQAAETWIAGWRQRFEEGLALDLVIADADTGEGVGEVGGAVVDQGRGAVEVGFWLVSRARGRRLASEAVRVLAEVLLASDVVQVVFARAQPGNGPAASVLTRAGFERRGRAENGHDVWQYGASSAA